VRKVLRSSYGSHYRKMLPPVFGALRFRCNNTAHRPLMDALELLRRYAHRERIDFYDHADRVPIDGVGTVQQKSSAAALPVVRVCPVSGAG